MKTKMEMIQRRRRKKIQKKMIFLQFRGKVSENFEAGLKKLKAPCKVIFGMKKLKTV